MSLKTSICFEEHFYRNLEPKERDILEADFQNAIEKKYLHFTPQTDFIFGIIKSKILLVSGHRNFIEVTLENDKKQYLGTVYLHNWKVIPSE